jgi:toxin ParE1/3/4
VQLKITRQPSAKRDLLEIWFYTAERWGAAQANHYVRLLDAVVERLRENSKLGTPVAGFRPIIRSIKAESHRIYYQQIENELQIVRVLHSNMDVVRHLE